MDFIYKIEQRNLLQVVQVGWEGIEGESQWG
jgi:hypothetical protein